MRYTSLRSFHAVASAGGFNAAAAELNITQPTLTAQVAALEAEYGVELFMKQGRHSRLTEAGHDLLAITTRMFLEEQEALAYLEQSRELRTGRLAIGAVSPYHVTEMLAVFQRKYSGIELSVSLGNTADVLQDLLDYRIDIAVLADIEVGRARAADLRTGATRSWCSRARITASRGAARSSCASSKASA